MAAGRSASRSTTAWSTASARSAMTDAAARHRAAIPDVHRGVRATAPRRTVAADRGCSAARGDGPGDRAPGCARRAPACTRRCTRREAFERSVAARRAARPRRDAPVRRAPRSTCRSGRRAATRSCASRSHELKAMRHALGGSVNDVVLAACTGGLRRLLDRPRRDAADARPARDGPDERPRHHRGASRSATRSPRCSSTSRSGSPTRASACGRSRPRPGGSSAPVPLPDATDALIDLAALAPPVVVHAALARTTFARRLFNVTITNVPGHREPLYAFGAQLREVLPVVPLAAEHAVGIAIFSYNGAVTFGDLRRLLHRRRISTFSPTGSRQSSRSSGALRARARRKHPDEMRI